MRVRILATDTPLHVDASHTPLLLTTFTQKSLLSIPNDIIVTSVSDAFVGTKVEHDQLVFTPMIFDDLEEMAAWPRFEKRELAWANFPAQTDELRKRWYNQQQKSHLQWIIIRDQSGKMIGRCSLSQPITGKQVLYGIVIRPDKLEQGYGTKSTRIMCAYIFSCMNAIESIWLESRYDNVRAQATWEKVGFTKLGRHFRREVFGRYDRYIGFELERGQVDLPHITIKYLD